MMNDTTNNLSAHEKATLAQHLLMHRAYPQLNPQPQGEPTMHITMHEEAPIEHAQDYPMVSMLLDALAKMEKHIDMIVETKFNQLVANTKALSLLDEQLREYITEVVDDKISDHEQAYGHNDFVTADNVSDIITEDIDQHIDHFLRHANHDLVSESRLAEMVRDTLDEQLDELLESKLDNATISISL